MRRAEGLLGGCSILLVKASIGTVGLSTPRRSSTLECRATLPQLQKSRQSPVGVGHSSVDQSRSKQRLTKLSLARAVVQDPSGTRKRCTAEQCKRPLGFSSKRVPAVCVVGKFIRDGAAACGPRSIGSR